MTAYQQKLEENLRVLNINEVETTIEDDWQCIKNAMLQSAETAEQFLGQKRVNARKEWLDQNCTQAISKRNIARKNYLERPTRNKREIYEDARREAKGVIKKRKRAYINSIMMKTEESFRNNNMREAYRNINYFKKEYQPSTTFCRTQNRELITERGKISKSFLMLIDK